MTNIVELAAELKISVGSVKWLIEDFYSHGEEPYPTLTEELPGWAERFVREDVARIKAAYRPHMCYPNCPC